MKLSLSKLKNSNSDKLSAIDRSQAIIEFTPEGIVTHANQNFLETMGYELSEIIGKHHSIFVDPEEAQQSDYKNFWKELREGQFRAREFRRISKSGKNVWIQASYNPIIDRHGDVTGIMKIATDTTSEKSKTSKDAGLITAINASQAVIHFAMDGTIQGANENFCKTLGYDQDEIHGKHHSMFVAPEDRNSDYDEFWNNLRAGKFQTAEFKRISKTGQPVYIQATYTPILNFRGKPYQVVKFATDITHRVKARMLRAETSAAIDRDLTEIEAFVRRASNQAQEAANASSESSSNVESVATGSAQSASSVSEIAGQASKASDISRDAVEQAASANKHIQALSQSADQIGAIISLISDIAEQTNLLALNATIEAARAGDAGKGFAVVASEVKQLATQSARASQDIGGQILSVQNATQEVVGAIESIAKVIADVNNISLSISSAVEEQAAVTRDISQNMSNATNAVANVSDGINTIADATREIEASTQKVKLRSASLA